MNWFYYFNYRIYKFYESKKESDPEMVTFFASVMLLFLNMISILFVINFYYPILNMINKYYFIGLYIFLCIVNYISFYKGKKYLKVFDDFSKQENDNPRRKIFFRVYFILTILIILVLLFFVEFKRKGII